MSLKLGSYSNHIRTTTGSADPEQQKCGVDVDWDAGRRPRARSLGVEDGHRSSTVRSESLYYSQSFSEVP